MKKEKDKRLFLPEDEFGEEASEGLGRLSRDEAEDDLRELKGRLRQRVSKPRHIWLQAAAALVVLLIASTVVIYVFREKDVAGTELAKSEEVVTDTALIALAEPIQKEEKGPVAAERKSGKGTVTAAAAVRARQVAGIEKEDAKSGIAEQPSGKAEAIAVAEVDTDVVMEAVQPAGAEEVSDEVAVPGEVAAEAIPDEVIVEALPMMQKAEMNEQAAAMKRSADKGIAASPSVVMPERQAAPVGGWEEFNRWTRPNTSLPGDVKPNVSRVVVVAFKVKTDSTLYDLKVIRSPDDSFTQAAFTMLREGPLWVPAMRDDKPVEEQDTISIIFK